MCGTEWSGAWIRWPFLWSWMSEWGWMIRGAWFFREEDNQGWIFQHICGWVNPVSFFGWHMVVSKVSYLACNNSDYVRQEIASFSHSTSVPLMGEMSLNGFPEGWYWRCQKLLTTGGNLIGAVLVNNERIVVQESQPQSAGGQKREWILWDTHLDLNDLSRPACDICFRIPLF